MRRLAVSAITLTLVGAIAFAAHASTGIDPSMVSVGTVTVGVNNPCVALPVERTPDGSKAVVVATAHFKAGYPTVQGINFLSRGAEQVCPRQHRRPRWASTTW